MTRSTSQTAPTNLLGSRVGNYVVESLIGQGGMGQVYLARHPELGREVAVKVLNANTALNSNAVARFRQEAMAAYRVGHSAIVEILDIGKMADGRHYYVMERLHGRSLHEHLEEKGPLGLEACLEILRPVAGALFAAHQAGIVHRDIKPENIFLSPHPEGGLQVKLLDFGIAKLTGDLAEPLVATATGALMGTPLFMSPEQCAGSGELGPAADIYALGAVLFAMLTGRPPFIGQGVGEVLVQHMQAPPPAVRDFRPELPRVLDDIIFKALAKRPEDRFADVTALKTALEEAVVSANPTEPAPATTVRLPETGERAGASSFPETTAVPEPRVGLSNSSLSAVASERVRLPKPAQQWSQSPLRTLALVGIVGLLIGVGAVALGVMLGRPAERSTNRAGPFPQAPRAGTFVIPPDGGAGRPHGRPTTRRSRARAAAAMGALKPPRPSTLAGRPIPLRPAGPARTIKLAQHPAAKAPPGGKPGPARPNRIQRQLGLSFLKKARKFRRRGMCRQASVWAKNSYRYLRSNEGIRIIGACACKLGKAASARWAYKLLSRSHRRRLKKLCARHKIKI